MTVALVPDKMDHPKKEGCSCVLSEHSNVQQVVSQRIITIQYL